MTFATWRGRSGLLQKAPQVAGGSGGGAEWGGSRYKRVEGCPRAWQHGGSRGTLRRPLWHRGNEGKEGRVDSSRRLQWGGWKGTHGTYPYPALPNHGRKPELWEGVLPQGRSTASPTTPTLPVLVCPVAGPAQPPPRMCPPGAHSTGLSPLFRTLGGSPGAIYSFIKHFLHTRRCSRCLGYSEGRARWPAGRRDLPKIVP